MNIPHRIVLIIIHCSTSVVFYAINFHVNPTLFISLEKISNFKHQNVFGFGKVPNVMLHIRNFVLMFWIRHLELGTRNLESPKYGKIDWNTLIQVTRATYMKKKLWLLTTSGHAIVIFITSYCSKTKIKEIFFIQYFVIFIFLIESSTLYTVGSTLYTHYV